MLRNSIPRWTLRPSVAVAAAIVATAPVVIVPMPDAEDARSLATLTRVATKVQTVNPPPEDHAHVSSPFCLAL